MRKGLLALTVDRAKMGTFDEDLVLVERFLAGDIAAFEALYARYYDKVLSIARGVLLDTDEAADAVQEVFTLVYRNLHRFDRRARFSTWLFRITVNRSIQEARRNRHRSKHVELDEAFAQAAPGEPEPPDPQVSTAMAKLAPADRALLALFYWDELSLGEIAESLGCNVNAAKTRLYRARERFRAVYEGETP
ncbi:sigma-70 family RNA polymerase sigma factor [bacterium]|nr:MAG: sigma-70 family RNA polymerase sigma factor [bacterium]